MKKPLANQSEAIEHLDPAMIRLETRTSDFGTITVSKRVSTNSIVYELDGRAQSEVDSNGISLAYYIHVVFGLILQTDAKNILMIGCGGGTLATMLQRTGRAVKVVDIDPSSFVLAKNYFSLPSDTPCHVGDAEEFLRSDADTYDAIVLDAFQGSKIPPKLRSKRFFKLARKHLAQDGAVFANIILENDSDNTADQIAKIMSGFFAEVRVMDTPGVRDRNAIVVSGAVGHLGVPKLIVRPEVSAGSIESQIAHMEFRPRRSAFWSLFFG